MRKMSKGFKENLKMVLKDPGNQHQEIGDSKTRVQKWQNRSWMVQ